MTGRRQTTSAKARGKTQERLDALNSELLSGNNPAQRIRRTLEGQIEQKARRRRNQQASASAGIKKR